LEIISIVNAILAVSVGFLKESELKKDKNWGKNTTQKLEKGNMEIFVLNYKIA